MIDLTITKNVVDKVKKLLIQEKNDNLNLRIYITGGGCVGHLSQYELI